MEYYGDQYDYSQIPDEGKWNPNQMLTITCRIHNESKEIRASRLLNHLSQFLCKKCASEHVVKLIKSNNGKSYKTLENFKKELQAKYGNKYSFNEGDYKDWQTLMLFHCNEHNEDFSTSPERLLKGTVCESCNDGHRKPRKPLTLQEYIEKASKVHHNKYDYSLIKEEDWNGINSYIDIRCPEHDDVFNVSARRHLEGKGKCPECWIEEHGKIYEISPEEIERRGREKHGNKYDYSRITESHRIHDIVNIICPDHGPFETTLSDHFSWKGCPECYDRESIGEKLTKDVLDSYNISFDDEVYLEGCDYKGHLFFDVYIEKYNICIEYQGAQHYMPIEKFGGEKVFQSISRDSNKGSD